MALEKIPIMINNGVPIFKEDLEVKNASKKFQVTQFTEKKYCLGNFLIMIAKTKIQELNLICG